MYHKVMVGGACGRWVSESSESKLEEIRERTPLERAFHYGCLLLQMPTSYKNLTLITLEMLSSCNHGGKAVRTICLPYDLSANSA